MSLGPEKYKIGKFLEKAPDPLFKEPLFFDSSGKCYAQLWSSV